MKNKITDEMLVKAFPNLYKNRYADKMSTCMCWGFECNLNGWGKIIWELSEKLEAEIVKMKEENPNEEFYPCASQVKEKFGSLRFYMNFTNEKMEKYINETENKSAKTCENCGKKGKIRNNGWVVCRCTECAILGGYLPKSLCKRLLKVLIEYCFNRLYFIDDIKYKLLKK